MHFSDADVCKYHMIDAIEEDQIRQGHEYFHSADSERILKNQDENVKKCIIYTLRVSLLNLFIDLFILFI